MSEPKSTTEGLDTPEEQGKGDNHKRRASAAALIEAFAQQYKADRQETGRREGHRIFREWLTIIGLFLAAVVAFFQWRELRSTDHSIGEQARIAADQLKIMQGQLDVMIRDQQPHLTLLDGKFQGPFFQPVSDNPAIGFASWNVPYINSGKGTAKDVVVNTYIFLGNGPFLRSNPVPRSEPVRMEEISPGENGFFTINSQAITKETFELLKAQELAIGIFYEFIYLDSLEKRYVTPYCNALYKTGAVARVPIVECRKRVRE